MKLFEKGELKLLWPFYLDALLSTILYFTPAFYVVFFKGLNFSLFQISLIMTSTYLTILLFEIPTGAIADLYGRKFSVLLGTFLVGIGLIPLIFITNFYLILLCFAFIGFGNTFISGAREAWVTDLIKSKNKNYLHAYFVKINVFDNIGLIFSGILGAFFVKHYGISIIWIMGFLAYLISFWLLILGKEAYKKREVHLKDSLKNINEQALVSLKYSRNHSVLFYFLIAMMVFAFAATLNDSTLSWIPLLQSFDFPDYAFGYVWSAIAIVNVLASLISTRLHKRNNERNFILIMVFLWAISSFLIVFIKTAFFALILLLILEFFDHSRRPAERIYFHRFIPKQLRATIGSIESMLISVVALIALPITGYLLDKIGPKYTIFISGFLIIPAVICYLLIRE